MFIALVSGPEARKTTAGIAGLLLKQLTMPNSMLYSKLDARFRDHVPNIGGVPVFGQMFCGLF